MTPLRRAVLGAFVPVAAAAASAAPPAEPLAISVRGPLFADSELVVEVRQSGALAGRRLAVQLAFDGASVGRYELDGETTTLRHRPSVPFPSGRHEIAVKSGSTRVRAEIRVWPGWLPEATLALVLLAGAGLALRRRRRRPTAT